jgi:antibiotic biosynthesis monooxygenase (ABM) superfamily enzyme
VISRVWHGWTKPENAAAYEALLRSEILPGIHRVPGFRGATLLRRSDGKEEEFVTITRFDDLDAVRAFAGEDYTLAVIAPDARPLLTRYDARSVHYETAFSVD